MHHHAMRLASEITALALTAAVLVGGSASCSQSDATERASILLITVDTLRADFLGTYGSPLGATPNMDAIAGRGVVFERAIAASTRTAPSHASIMTSTWTRGHSIGPINGKTALVGGETLAELADRVGYRTAAFVGNFVLKQRSGLDRGFHRYDDELPSAERNRSSLSERVAGDTTPEAIEWIRDQAGAPILVWVHYQDPHGPYTPPPEYEQAFAAQPAPNEVGLPVNPTDDDERGIPAYQALPGLTRPSEYSARYAAEIAYADESIGRLVEAFDAHTGRSGPGGIILLTADHGESMGEEERYFGHGFTTTPDLAHVPFLLVAPHLEPGRRDEVVSHVDVLPTLVELADLPSPAAASGTSLVPLVRGSGSIPERLVYCDNGFELSAYAGTGFTRVRGIPLVKADDMNLDVIRRAATSWQTYRWRAGDPWAPDASGTPSRNAIETHMSRTTPIALTRQPLSTADRRKLKALGYTVD